TPFFVVFGWLSDKWGRKWIMLTGMLMGVIFYRPIFGTMLKDADVKQWMKTEYIFIKEDVKISMHNGDSVLQISTQYQTPDKTGFTRVITDTLTKGRDELQHIIQTDKNAVFTN